ncbi:MAG TPA: hypothetical protein VJ826_07440 [Candidatus Polarisedimenticolaceae bacterium]|nr:hypothetical protein [Candidatus Polarisedimenticolaceae bacterium]
MTLRVLLWITALFSGVLVWLPLVRGATQGTAYHWALAPGIGGSGIGGWYWLLPIALVFVLSLLYLGWRGARWPFHLLLLAFHLPLAAAVAHAARTDPENFRLEGETIGLNVSLAILGPLLFTGVAALAVLWVVKDLRAGPRREGVPWVWTRATKIRVGLVLLLFPVEAVLFRSGGMQSVPNMIGVAAVAWQWIMINLVLAGARDVG